MELYHDNFQNFKRYDIPKAQLVIADIPYNIGIDAYASNPMWYEVGNNKNGESKHAKSAFFSTDGNFKIAEYMHFCNRLLIKEPKERGKAPAMIVFCAFEQMQTVIEYGKRYGFMKSYPLFFCKNYSAQVLKANMKIVGATEFAVVLYRDKLPKFRNNGKMVFNWFEWRRDNVKEYPKIHPTQKPISVLKRLIEIFTDPGDIIIDPVAGSGSTLRAAFECGRNSYGFEVSNEFYQKAKSTMLKIDDSQISFDMLGARAGYCLDADAVLEGRLILMQEQEVEYIKENLDEGERLLCLIEECTELAETALKLRRVLDGRNPTPITLQDAFSNLLEKYGDVINCIEVLITPTQNAKAIQSRLKKRTRWVQRLKERNERSKT